jgi:hypothetical protein
MRKLIDLILNEGELTVPQQLGQWARSHGGRAIDKQRVAVEAMDTTRFLDGSAIFVVITVARDQSQGFVLNVDLVLGMRDEAKLLDYTRTARLVDGHSWDRAESADETLRYAEQLRTTVKTIVGRQRLDAAVAELQSRG